MFRIASLGWRRGGFFIVAEARLGHSCLPRVYESCWGLDFASLLIVFDEALVVSSVTHLGKRRVFCVVVVLLILLAGSQQLVCHFAVACCAAMSFSCFLGVCDRWVVYMLLLYPLDIDSPVESLGDVHRDSPVAASDASLGVGRLGGVEDASCSAASSGGSCMASGGGPARSRSRGLSRRDVSRVRGADSAKVARSRSLARSPTWPDVPEYPDVSDGVGNRPVSGVEGAGGSSRHCSAESVDLDCGALALELHDKEEDPEALERDPEREPEPPVGSPFSDLIEEHEADLVRRRRRVQINALRARVDAEMPGYWDALSVDVNFLRTLCLCNLDDDGCVRELYGIIEQSHRGASCGDLSTFPPSGPVA